MKRCFLLCTDSNEEYFENGLLVTIRSLVRTHPDIPIIIFHNELTREQTSRLPDCTLIYVDDLMFRASHRADLSKATFLKFHAGLLKEFDRALYMDHDIVVLDRLDGIFSKPGHLVAKGHRDRAWEMEFYNPSAILKKEGIRKGTLLLNGGVVCFDT